jgi:hypothetical protein
LEAFEHSRIIHPSTLVTLYLLITIVQDGTEAVHVSASATLYLDLILRIVMLSLEIWPKTSFLAGNNDYSPEETSGLIGKWLFLWVNPFLFKGYRGAIRESDVYPLDRKLKSKALEDEMLRIWLYC